LKNQRFGKEVVHLPLICTNYLVKVVILVLKIKLRTKLQKEHCLFLAIFLKGGNGKQKEKNLGFYPLLKALRVN
jgi:hypothetical protein